MITRKRVTLVVTVSIPADTLDIDVRREVLERVATTRYYCTAQVTLISVSQPSPAPAKAISKPREYQP